MAFFKNPLKILIDKFVEITKKYTKMENTNLKDKEKKDIEKNLEEIKKIINKKQTITDEINRKKHIQQYIDSQS